MKLLPSGVSFVLFILCGIGLYFSHASAHGNNADPFSIMCALGCVVFGIALLVFLDKISEGH